MQQPMDKRNGRGRARANPLQPSPRQNHRTPQPSTPAANHGGSGDGPSTSAVGGRGTARGAVQGTVQRTVQGTIQGTVQGTAQATVQGNRNASSDILWTRPQDLPSKRGNTGREINLMANYFNVKKHCNWSLYQYRVDFSPDEERTIVRRGMVRTAARQHIRGYIFDGTVLYTIERLAVDPLELFVSSTNDSEQKTRITIRLVGDVGAGDFHYYQVFNILMRKCLGHLKLQLVGRNFFDANAATRLPDYNMELWPGYSTSIRQHENQVLMCCDITHKVMRLETVTSVLSRMSQRYGDLRQNFEAEILGAIVLTDYNNRTYRIDEVDWQSTPMSKFEKSGVQVSYADYYKTKYGITIKNMTQPMLVSVPKARDQRAGRTDPILLVPELCRMTGLTDDDRNNQRLMRALADHTRVGPADRTRKLLDFNQRLHTEPNVTEEFKKWDLNLDRSLVQLKGRSLPNEKIFFGRNMQVDTNYNVDWTQAMFQKQMISLPPIQNCYLVVPKRLQQDALNFMNLVRSTGLGMGMSLPPIVCQSIDDDRPHSYTVSLSTLAKKSPQIVAVVVPNIRADRYGAIKKICYVDNALPCQVIQSKNFAHKSARAIATKIAIQMNCKLGGAPWSVDIPMSDLMLVGFDVCPDKVNKAVSFGAMVASLNKNCTRYYSAVTQHKNGDELSNSLALNMLKAVKKYQAVNGHNPGRIVLYRDGVGDGQLSHVFEHEVEEIRNKLTKHIYTKNDLRLCVIIVSKRINTRFFTSQRENPPPGTVVDDVVTLPERYDFFIVSQCTRQGTVSPTSYNVIYDNVNLGPDRLQRLTYKLTHLYFNWSGTVSVPAPCQYAHKLAFLVAQYLHKAPQGGLEDTLYYL